MENDLQIPLKHTHFQHSLICFLAFSQRWNFHRYLWNQSFISSSVPTPCRSSWNAHGPSSRVLSKSPPWSPQLCPIVSILLAGRLARVVCADSPQCFPFCFLFAWPVWIVPSPRLSLLSPVFLLSVSDAQSFSAALHAADHAFLLGGHVFFGVPRCRHGFPVAPISLVVPAPCPSGVLTFFIAKGPCPQSSSHKQTLPVS